jgi:hypothetical protein
VSVDRRTVLLGLGATALTGCATPGSALYQIIDSYQAIERRKKQYPSGREAIDAQAQGVLGVQVEGGLKGLVVCEKRENGYDYWRSSNGVLIVTQAGRLIRTEGFPQDQTASRVISGVEYLGTRLDPDRRYQVRREISYAPDQYGVEVISDMRFVRHAQLDLLGHAHDVSEWRETLRLPKIRRSWTQLIQIDRASAEVVRSIQHVGPKMRVILEVLKSPARA